MCLLQGELLDKPAWRNAATLPRARVRLVPSAASAQTGLHADYLPMFIGFAQGRGYLLHFSDTRGCMLYMLLKRPTMFPPLQAQVLLWCGGWCRQGSRQGTTHSCCGWQQCGCGSSCFQSHIEGYWGGSIWVGARGCQAWTLFFDSPVS